MKTKTEKRVGALRRLIQKKEQSMIRYFGREEELRIEREIETLRKRIPAEVLAREGLL